MHRFITTLAVSSLAVAGTAFAGGACCGSEAAPAATTVAWGPGSGYGDQAKANIVETAVGAGNFNTLAAALDAADLVSTLEGDGPFTVFAPTDQAFSKLPAGTVEALLRPENVEKLRSILTYHVVSGKVKAKDVVNLNGAQTVNGQRLDIKVKNDEVYVDGAKVVATDVAASNGVIHVIDSVVLPADKDIVQTAKGAGSFSTLVAALDAAGLVSTLEGDGPFTVFAPTDAAFAKLPAGTVESLLRPENRDQLVKILTYHVAEGRVYSDALPDKGEIRTVEGSRANVEASGSGAMIENASIIKTDIDASNGVIHVIDTVIIPE